MTSPISRSELCKDFFLYRNLVASQVSLPALVFGPMERVGEVLAVLRGHLYAKRGIRNVLDVWIEETPEGKAFIRHAGGREEEKAQEKHDENERKRRRKEAEMGMSSSSSSTKAIRRYKLLLMDPEKWSAPLQTPDFFYTMKEEQSDTNETNRKSKTPPTTGPTLTPSSPHCSVHLASFSSMMSTIPMPLPTEVMTRLENAVKDGDHKHQKKKKEDHSAAVGSASASAASWVLGVSCVSVSLTYKNYTMPELLQRVFAYPFSPSPPSSPLGSTEETVDTSSGALVALSGFEQVGHIAHLNLRTAYVPFQYVIGQIVLDCNPTVEVVVNKLETIASVFREFKMDIIAHRGATNVMELTTGIAPSERSALLLATVRQEGCLFRIPYDAVYWNSRLSHEHQRLIDFFHPGDVLMDVMAGVGPFAVPAAVKGVAVFANDLNPAAAKYLAINASLNNTSLQVYNLDGRVFLNSILYTYVRRVQKEREHLHASGDRMEENTHTKDENAKSEKEMLPTSLPHSGERTSNSTHPPLSPGKRIHVVMNLPAIAVEFLDVFSPQVPPEEKSSAVPSPWRGVSSVSAASLYSSTMTTETTQPSTHPWLVFHVYCFSSAPDVLEDAVLQVNHHLGYTLEKKKDIQEVMLVRNVAPTKRMVCVRFTLPEAFWKRQTTT